jgi:membrane protein implicated in regulation of membrane protease activity
MGGLLGVLLAALSPEFFTHTFIGAPQAFSECLQYAWVGGSIWGVQFGGAAAVLVVSVLFRAAWRQRVQDSQADLAKQSVHGDSLL